MFNHEWETIPTEEIKRMLWSCITESARKEIVLFHPKGSAFEKSEIGVFYRNVEILTKEICGRPETGILKQETGKGGR